jgi:hypothetical protein
MLLGGLMKRWRKRTWVLLTLCVLVLTGALAGGSKAPPKTPRPQAHAAKARPKAKPAAKKAADPCETSPKCKRETAETLAEVKKGEEYARIHRPEQEAQQKEYERRARGELTPEEEKNREAKQKEVEAEVESIREGHRLSEEGK